MQKRYVAQLRALQERHRAPVVLAGDLFDRWNPSHLLVNHLIGWLRGMDVHAIPGNHDLPHHSYTELDRSAYWTLVEAGALRHLSPGGAHAVGNMSLHAFPFGWEVTPPEPDNSLPLRVAVVHDYIWAGEKKHEGAADDKRFAHWVKRLAGYDAAVFGDNHKGFYAKGPNGVQVWNCGTFMRRHADEHDYRPRVGLLMLDGSFQSHYLDTAADEFADTATDAAGLERALRLDLDDFVEQLDRLKAERHDYARVVLLLLEREKASEDVRRVVLRALGVTHADRKRG